MTQYSNGEHALTDAALNMAGKGFAIVPIHNFINGRCSCRLQHGCHAAGKHPRQAGWQHKHSTDRDQLVRWWRTWPLANVGIVTGPPSGIFVLDFDVKNGGLDTLAQLEAQYPEMRDTFRVRTGGGGWHLYFQMPETGHVRNRIGALPGVDVRGDNGMVLAAGSAHASGGVYRVETDQLVIRLPGDLERFFIHGHKRGHKQDRRCSLLEPENAKNATKIAETAVIVQGYRHTVQIQLADLTLEQRDDIASAMRLSTPDAAGQRNRRTFDFARRLQALTGFEQRTTDPNTLRGIVKVFQGAMMAAAAGQGFAIRGTFADTFQDFRNAWPRITTPGGSAMSVVIGACLDSINNLPSAVADCLNTLGYDDDSDTAALVLLLWFLDQQWCSSFPLSSRIGAMALAELGTSSACNFQWVSRRLLLLAADGVIECTHASKPGQRGVASEYAWRWGITDADCKHAQATASE